MQPSLTISCGDQLPNVYYNEHGPIVNLALTLPESAFAGFVGNNIHAALKDGMTCVFLGSQNIDAMQGKFKNFMVCFMPRMTYSLGEYSILPLISSIWQKTRVYTDNKLFYYDKSKIEDEKKQVEHANS